MARITINSLSDYTKALLLKWGVPSIQADVITNTIVYAHQHEKHTHGITRLPIYKKKIDQGWLTPNTLPVVTTDFAAISVLNCNNGFGQVVAEQAMKLAVEKAALYGIGTVFVSNSNNFGVAGYFGEIAANAGMVGMVLTASAPAIAPEGGYKSIFGTNPICVAYPSEDGNYVLDMAISAAARGKIRLAEKNGEKIPFGWAVDKDGNPTDDPTAALAGNMLAIGGVKGFGLAMVADLFAGLLSGSSFGGNIKPLACETDYSRHGHLFAAINIEKLMPKDEYNLKIKEFVSNIKACGEPGAICLPGERSRNKAMANSQSVELKQKQIDDFNDLLQANFITNRLEIKNE